jgi:hypothetical protein
MRNSQTSAPALVDASSHNSGIIHEASIHITVSSFIGVQFESSFYQVGGVYTYIRIYTPQSNPLFPLLLPPLLLPLLPPLLLRLRLKMKKLEIMYFVVIFL